MISTNRIFEISKKKKLRICTDRSTFKIKHFQKLTLRFD